MKYTIDHEKYGQRATFKSLAEAQSCIRNGGPELAATTLSERWQKGRGEIMDEENDIVGEITE